jgi:hypothetical protein
VSTTPVPALRSSQRTREQWSLSCRSKNDHDAQSSE